MALYLRVRTFGLSAVLALLTAFGAILTGCASSEASDAAAPTPADSHSLDAEAMDAEAMDAESDDSAAMSDTPQGEDTATASDTLAAEDSRVQPPQRVLIFTRTKGFRHASIEPGVAALMSLAAGAGLLVDHTEDATVFGTELSQYSVVVFLSTTGDVLNADQQAALREHIEGGAGWLGIHAAADTEYDWPWYGELVGAWFKSHPAIQAADVLVDTEHPATDMLPAVWNRTDEWYDFRTPPPSDATVLMRVDESTYDGGTTGPDHPIGWARAMGAGRTIYTAGGHTTESYEEPLFRAHVLAALLWAAGLEP